MGKPLFALIKWVTGADAGSFTAGISVDWIRDFNAKQFDSDNVNPKKIYAIEWRNSTKGPPPGGWKLYDGQVIGVSSKYYASYVLLG